MIAFPAAEYGRQGAESTAIDSGASSADSASNRWGAGPRRFKVSHAFRQLTIIAQTWGDAGQHLERFAAAASEARPE